jgi:hypothetical protein
MKKIIIYLCIILTATACGESKEDKAHDRLIAARTALEREDFNEAKLQIDSIKILYPQEYEVRQEGQDLLCIVVIKEQQHNLRFLTSMLQTKEQEFAAIKGQFILEKNSRYQEVGNYMWPSQTVERNLHRSFLRFQVSEQGVMTLSSIYHGSRALHHSAVKVIAPDGTYAATPACKDVFRDHNLGEWMECADFHYGMDGGVINFLYLNQNKSIRVEFLGGSRYVTSLSSSDRSALIHVYSLTRVLGAIQQIKQEIEEANVKIKFILKKQKYESMGNHQVSADSTRSTE